MSVFVDVNMMSSIISRPSLEGQPIVMELDTGAAVSLVKLAHAK